MPNVPVYNTQGAQVGEITLSDSIFGVKVNQALLHEAVIMQLAGARQGTASTKNRSAVRGGGRKPWRQKGTGQARVGSRRSPLWTGGGVTFGPSPRNYGYDLPKKARRAALKSALSSKVAAGEIRVMESFEVAEPKTRLMAGILDKLQTQKTLIVTANPETNIYKSARNIPGVTTMVTEGLNVYDILACDQLVITKEAVGKVEEALA